MNLTYSRYLQLDRLLDLQTPRSDPVEHDEMLFIVIHQVYELWFKQVLWELDRLKLQFSDDDLFGAIATIKRVRTILKTLVGQLDILETMTPMSFVAFRDRLETSSGFQSTQFRELEFVLGHKRDGVLHHLEEGSAGYRRADRRLEERSVIDHFYDLLEQRGLAIPAGCRDKAAREPNRAEPGLEPGLLRLYRDQPEMAILFELMMDMDEGLQEWHYRHVKIVERTIGNKPGTGHSSGVGYLKQSLFRQTFPDLWAIRHAM